MDAQHPSALRPRLQGNGIVQILGVPSVDGEHQRIPEILPALELLRRYAGLLQRLSRRQHLLREDGGNPHAVHNGVGAYFGAVGAAVYRHDGGRQLPLLPLDGKPHLVPRSGIPQGGFPHPDRIADGGIRRHAAAPFLLRQQTAHIQPRALLLHGDDRALRAAFIPARPPGCARYPQAGRPSDNGRE